MSSKKLTIFLGITLIIGLLVTGLASATHRCVVAEVFTSCT